MLRIASIFIVTHKNLNGCVEKYLVTVKSQVEARVTIQKIKYLGFYKLRHVTKQDMLLFINSKILKFEVTISNMP